MYDLLFALIIGGGFALGLAATYLVFYLFLYMIYRIDGGKMGLWKYLNK